MPGFQTLCRLDEPGEFIGDPPRLGHSLAQECDVLAHTHHADDGALGVLPRRGVEQHCVPRENGNHVGINHVGRKCH